MNQMCSNYVPLGMIVIFMIISITQVIRRKFRTFIVIVTGHEAQKILKSNDYNRQKHNEWLIDTLSIVNPFTIEDESLRRSFKNNAIKLLSSYNNEKNYEDLVLTIRSRIENRISLMTLNDSKLCLSKFIKQIALDCFLKGILHVNADENLLTELPELIIHLWKNRNDKEAKDRLQVLLDTNKDQFSESDAWQKIHSLLLNHSNVISKVVINDFDEKISSPLNIIVPGWETMWRVVFYTLLELIRRPDLLQELRLNLNDHSNSYKNCRLLEFILKETLRLYPPTKNIYRTNLKTGEDLCIKVQEIHRNQNVWGSNALSFDPYRFYEKLTEEQDQSYLPFSITCPARFGFAYKFAGIMIGEILKCCPNFNIAQESPQLPTTNELLDLKRDSYSKLLINI